MLKLRASPAKHNYSADSLPDNIQLLLRKIVAFLQTVVISVSGSKYDWLDTTTKEERAAAAQAQQARREAKRAAAAALVLSAQAAAPAVPPAAAPKNKGKAKPQRGPRVGKQEAADIAEAIRRSEQDVSHSAPEVEPASSSAAGPSGTSKRRRH